MAQKPLVSEKDEKPKTMPTEIDQEEDEDIRLLKLKRFKQELLLQAVTNEREDKVVELLNDPLINVDEADDDGNFILIEAVKQRRLRMIDTILSSLRWRDKIDYNIRDKKSGKTPLIYASISGDVPIAKLLLDRRVRALTTKRDSNVPLRITRLSHVDLADNSGKTALIYAATYNRVEMVRYLLKNRANPNLVDEKGKTALIYAANYSNQQVVSMLLANGMARVDYLESEDRATALNLAARVGDEKVAEVLLDKGAAWCSRDRSGRTPLSNAAQNGHGTVVKLLLARGAVTTCGDKNGDTPGDLAKAFGHKDVHDIINPPYVPPNEE